MNVLEIYAIFLICFLSGIFVGAVLLAFYDASHENDWRSVEQWLTDMRNQKWKMKRFGENLSFLKRYCLKHKRPADCAGCALKGKGHCTLHDMPQVWETWDLAERLARAADEVEKNGKRKA